MRTLLLLRHAKSSWGNDSLPDHDRPLNRRGREAATGMGRYLRDAGPVPDLALCSTAVRARETLDRLLESLGRPVEVRLDRALYLASDERLAERIAAAPEEAGVLLVVAHNPGMARLAVRLAATGDAASRGRLQRKLPTAGLARLEADAARWGDLVRGGGELAAFVRPKDLVC